MKGSKSILFLILFSFVISSKAQLLNELKEKKQKTRHEIEYTNLLLNKTSEKSKVSLNKLALLNEQITLRNELITDYNTQLHLLQNSIDDHRSVIEMMSEDLENIRSEYARLIQQAYRKRGDYNQLIFILSSESFNQAYKRLLYTQQMTKYRQKQLEQIEAIRKVLELKNKELNQRKKEQQEVLLQQMEETSVLNLEKGEMSSYYQQLQNRQTELKKHLKYQQRIEKKLEKEIEKAIAEEAKKAKLIAKTPEEKLLSTNFEKNKGQFPWPTQHGIITDKFGEHAHPVMQNIIIQNNGIDITTKSNEKARAIFQGVVSKIFAIPGGNTAVIIRHGEYITVYSNLVEVYVKQGETVKLKQEIGLIFSDKEEDNKTILKFQIWKESVKLNPELWITK
jgi:septal ring factor EnvC (AmiA/AmiB activator)